MAHESFEDADVARGDERALRQHQGRPRGAARPRPDLPDRARAADAALGRLAADDVPDARRRAVLRAARISRSRGATGCRASSTCCRDVAAAYREQGDRHRRAERSGSPRRWRRSSPRAAAAALPAHAPRDRARGARSERFDPRARRLRRRAQVPAPDRARVLPARVRRSRRRRGARRSCARRSTRMADGGIHDQLGGGFCRYSVDARMDDPALREDALRQRAAAGALRGRWRARPATRATRDVARDIVGWLVREMRARRRRVLLEPRRRQRRRGRQVLRVDARRGARAIDPPTNGRSPRRTSASTGRRTSRATRGTCASSSRSSESPRSSASRCPTRRRGSRARGPRCSRARETRVRPGPRRQDPDVVERAGDRGARARGARAGRAALGRPRARRRPTRCARTAWRDGRLLATRRGDRADLNAYLDDYAFLLAALVEVMQTRFRREDFDWARRARRRAARALRGSRARRLLVHEPRPREALPPHEARATTTRRRRATASPRRR